MTRPWNERKNLAEERLEWQLEEVNGRTKKVEMAEFIKDKTDLTLWFNELSKHLKIQLQEAMRC